MRWLSGLMQRYWEWLNDSGAYKEAYGRLWVIVAPLMLLLTLIMLWLFQ